MLYVQIQNYTGTLFTKIDSLKSVYAHAVLKAK